MKLLRVFDIDDTLIVTNAKNFVLDNKNNLKCAITPKQYNDFKEFLGYLRKNKIAKLSYDEFGINEKLSIDILENGDFIIKYICKLLSAYNKKSEDVALLTARSMDPKAIKKFFKNRLNLNIPISKIRAISWRRDRSKKKNNNDHQDMMNKLLKKYKNKKEFNIINVSKESVEHKKKMAMFSFIDMGYHNIVFYDDDKNNVKIMKKLEKELKNLDPKKYKDLKIDSKFVPEKDRTKNYEIMDRRVRKKLFDYIYPNGNICKEFFDKEFYKFIKLKKITN